MERDDRIKWDVFQGKSTYLNDYRYNKIKQVPDKKDVLFEPKEKQSAEYVPIDMETFVPWKKGSKIPFYLYHTRKDVIGTHPQDTIKRPDPIIDTGKDEAIRTRPRIYMKSAVSIDDVPDKEMRKFVCDAVYTTDARCSEREAVGAFTLKSLPDGMTVGAKPKFNVDFEESPQHLTIDHLQRVDRWDNEQLRTLTNPNRMFWTHTRLPTRDGGPLTDLVAESKKEEIKSLIEEDMLRLPHDYPKPLYAGYKPMLSYGIPLRKKVEAITHPFISTGQAITMRYEKD